MAAAILAISLSNGAAPSWAVVYRFAPHPQRDVLEFRAIDRPTEKKDAAAHLPPAAGFARTEAARGGSGRGLANYAGMRDELQPSNQTSFFVSLKRKRLLYAVVQDTFRELVDTAGIGVEAPSPPRLHDLRHSFAVRTLLGWYRAGEDVQAKMPSLSTYLGHREPACTYWYLSAVPELLALAAARQDTAWLRARTGGRS